MTHIKTYLGSSALVLSLASMAQADVTAQDVWNNMSGFYAASGYSVEPGSINDSGDTLTLSDINVSMPNPYADMQSEIEFDINFTIGEMVLSNNGDGTVSITMSDEATMIVDIAPEGEDPGRLGMTFNQAGMQMTASGDPDRVMYDFSGPGMSGVIDLIEIPDEPDVSDAIVVEMSIGAYEGSYALGSGDAPELNMEFTSAGMDAVVAVTPPGEEGSLNAVIAMRDMAWDATGTYAMAEKPGDIASMLRAGFASAGTISHGGSEYSMDFQDGSDAFAMAGSSSSGSVVFAMDAEGLAYEVSSTDMSTVVSGSEIPLPEIAISAAASTFGLVMPVLASDTAQDLGLTFALEGLQVSDMIWGMIDAGGQLPHDPATLIVELAGKANWFMDIMDPASMENFGGGLPGSLESMDINKLQLSIVGAELTGEGGFTFDMNDFQSYGGAPAPTGSIDLTLSGSNALMDKLVAMGLLPEEQVMGAKMMMGMFAVPAGDDVLTSKIELDGKGGISANGTPLQ